jgi:hypothetical protein
MANQDVYNISNYIRPPPKLQDSHGLLDSKFQWIDLTTAIGREYPTLNLDEILESEELLRDLALTGM